MKRSDFFELWIVALESGEDRQGKGMLTMIVGNKQFYCCLGVACRVGVKNGLKVPSFENLHYLPDYMQRFLGVNEQAWFIEPVRYRGRDYDSLAQMNDHGLRFKTIARIIREQLELGNFQKNGR